MAKKYLLYIHDERFTKEQNKSALINGLLAEHYRGSRSSPLTKDDIAVRPMVIEPEFKPCKHGYSPSFCKHAKNGKPCS